MSYFEYAGNPHVHSSYSDGTLLHAEIARAASAAGLNFVIVTDHNLWVNGLDGYTDGVAVLIGQELHNVRRQPQSSHLLAFNANAELAPKAGDPQQLINTINERGGSAFLAHPFEYGSRIREGLEAIPWIDWEVSGYTGLEIWNYMSEFKSLLRSRLAALFYMQFPALGIVGPFRATLKKWDELLMQGHRVAAIGSADAHGTTYTTIGHQKNKIFPYKYLFRCVNTHILTEQPLNGMIDHDKNLIYAALRSGHTWASYDLPASTAGFRFTARSGANQGIMGDEMARTGATIFVVQVPQPASIRLVRNGKTAARAQGTYLRHTTAEPGAYRVEAHLPYKLGRRGWIFSSPITIV